MMAEPEVEAAPEVRLSYLTELQSADRPLQPQQESAFEEESLAPTKKQSKSDKQYAKREALLASKWISLPLPYLLDRPNFALRNHRWRQPLLEIPHSAHETGCTPLREPRDGLERGRGCIAASYGASRDGEGAGRGRGDGSGSDEGIVERAGRQRTAEADSKEAEPGAVSRASLSVPHDSLGSCIRRS